MKKSKRYREIFKKVDKNKAYSFDEAIELVKNLATAKFEETVELAIKLGIDTQHSDTQVRGAVTLPKGTGKKVCILAIAEGESAEKAKKEGADFVGADELIAKIEGGWIDFDAVVTTPDMMKKLAKVGKILGPRGLMPSPKTGTVSGDIGGVIREMKLGRIEFRNDKFGNLHLPIGKSSFPALDLKENIVVSLRTIIKEKPSHTKGLYLNKAYLCTSMGPSVKLDVGQLMEDIKK